MLLDLTSISMLEMLNRCPVMLQFMALVLQLPSKKRINPRYRWIGLSKLLKQEILRQEELLLKALFHLSQVLSSSLLSFKDLRP